MFGSFFRQLIGQSQKVVPVDVPTAKDKGEVPPGVRIYAIGDVHGRADLLQRALDTVDADLAADPADHSVLIGIGDYIDRGPDSRGVLQTLSKRRGDAVFLKGNHEQMLLSFLSDPARFGPNWLKMGGWECLRSYSVQCRPHERDKRELARVRDDLLAKMPRAHRELLGELKSSYAVGGYFFAHAGARVGVPLDRQTEDDLLWIRKGFSDQDSSFEKLVVHGHTPVPKPFVGLNRINIDTGAYATGKLTLVILQGRGVRFA